MNAGDATLALINAGGFATLAGVLLLLHIQSVKDFRKELRAQRAGFEARTAALISAIDRQTVVLSDRFREMADQLSGRPQGFRQP